MLLLLKKSKKKKIKKKELISLRKIVKKRLEIKKKAKLITKKTSKLTTRRESLKRNLRRLKSGLTYKSKLNRKYEYPQAKIKALKKETSYLSKLVSLSRLFKISKFNAGRNPKGLSYKIKGIGEIKSFKKSEINKIAKKLSKNKKSKK